METGENQTTENEGAVEFLIDLSAKKWYFEKDTK